MSPSCARASCAAADAHLSATLCTAPFANNGRLLLRLAKLTLSALVWIATGRYAPCDAVKDVGMSSSPGQLTN